MKFQSSPVMLLKYILMQHNVENYCCLVPFVKKEKQELKKIYF
jgi:hypothetical protein